MQQILDKALAALADPQVDVPVRQQAIPLLAFVEFDQAREILAGMLQPQQGAAIQAAAVRTFAGHRHVDIPTILVSAYRRLAADARFEAVDALLARADWHSALLDAIDAGTITVAEIPHLRRNLLIRSVNASIKERSIKMFRTALESRQKVVDKYRDALSQLKPDRSRGEVVFRRECQSCHRVNNIGQDIGPNLATIRHRAPEEIVLHILDPNREVGPNFVAYVIVTDDGRVLTGLIVEESAHSVTLLRSTGTRETILRANIEELSATGQSLMPSGLEDRITPQEMTDLLLFVLKP